jgi:hypothetical protein
MAKVMARLTVKLTAKLTVTLVPNILADLERCLTLCHQAATALPTPDCADEAIALDHTRLDHLT